MAPIARFGGKWLAGAHKKTQKNKAMQRAELIMKVRCGLMTAAQAAAQLGVSRKTYYKWEQRGLCALLLGLSDQGPGRPQKADNAETAALEKQLADIQKAKLLLEQKMILKDLAAEFNIRSKDRNKKK